jgi:hypothetical protein
MKFLTLSVFAFLLAAPGMSYAEEKQNSEYVLVIKDHKFSPETLEIPADKKVKITVDNQDASPEEFESHELNREKIIPGNSKGIIFVGPLKPGTYPFFGEFNMATAKGQIVVK